MEHTATSVGRDGRTSTVTPDRERPVSPWLTAQEAAEYARCRGCKTIYQAVKQKKLRAARANRRGDLRFRTAWIDDWLEASTEIEVG